MVTLEYGFDRFRELAGRYAAELTAQFRTLSLFISHRGEVGRSHEEFLRAVIRRFLPNNVECGTGFVLSGERASAQQDCIVFSRNRFAALFEVGDCVVVDEEAVGACLEVKTSCDSPKLEAALEKLINLHRSIHKFQGMYVWEGLSLERALNAMWQVVGSDIKLAWDVPNVILCPGEFILIANYDGEIVTPPFHAWRIGEGGVSDSQISDGHALLLLLHSMWLCGVQQIAEWPKWLSELRRADLEARQEIPWPADLLEAVRSESERRQRHSETK